MSRGLMREFIRKSGSGITGALLVVWCVGGAALLWSLAAGTGCERSSRLNVLLLTLDTTRADHIRCYGHNMVETPALNRLAREGVLFERAYSHVPLTLPAHTSILSGTVPLYHGVADNGGYRVPPKLETMAEVLKEAGYNTAAFISAAVLKKVFNLDQGFDHWDEEDIEPQVERSALVAERKADVVTDASLEWLDENTRKPFFLWVHYYDPHAQYEPPESYRALYRNLYDAEIAFMDAQIKRVINKLIEAGIYDNTLIIAVGDHGEGLGDHEERTHATFIYESTQHVPLIMRIPGVKDPGRRIKTVASQMDIMPTVLDYLGIERTPNEVEGKSLRSIIEANPHPSGVERFAFLESKWAFLHYNWSPLAGIVGENYKYIKAPTPELYDLEEDPGELHNIAEEEKKIAAQLRSRLEEMENRYGKARLDTMEADVSPELQKQLEALGYIVGSHKGDPEKALEKDPKDYKDVMQLLMNANSALAASKFKNLLEMSEKALEKDPENPQALQNRADALFGLGRNQEALEAYRHYFDTIEETHVGYNKIGSVYIRMGGIARSEKDFETAQAEYRKAIEAFEKSLELRERNPFAHYYIGRIYLDLGEMEKAREKFAHPTITNNELGHLGMAAYYRRLQRPGLAEAEFKRAEELIEDESVLYMQEYAQFLMSQEKYSEVVELLEDAIEEQPSLENEPALMKALNEAREKQE